MRIAPGFEYLYLLIQQWISSKRSLWGAWQDFSTGKGQTGPFKRVRVCALFDPT